MINPSGINFGSNARLDIGGSFLASTANSLKFADGTEFSALNPQASPTLTISVPIGLQLGRNSGAINVQGVGHNLSLINSFFLPITRGNTAGLKVQPGHTLALIGSGVNLQGGTLTAEGGRIELGSVGEGLVSLSPIPQGWSFSYQGLSNFQDINLSQKALVDTSGVGSSGIQFQGRNVSISDGSVILIQNQGSQTAGNININASDSFNITGTTLDGKIPSGLLTQTVGSTKGGDITISTPSLVANNGGQVIATTYSNAPSGNVTINAPISVQVKGYSPINPTGLSDIGTSTYSSGQSGDTTVSTGDLTISDGAIVGAGTFATGSAGDIFVNATKSVQVVGADPILSLGSLLGVSTLNTGNAGSIIVNTPKLVVQNGGRVDSSSTATGSAGSVTINAKDSVEVSGTIPGTNTPSLVSSGATVENAITRQLLHLPNVPSGSSGDVTINTNQLKVSNGGQITTSNQGTGNSGNVNITANSILLDSGATITSELGGTFKGGQLLFFSPVTLGANKEGDIRLSTQQLTVQGAAAISTATYTNATGGNIIINAPQSVQVIGPSSFNPSALSFIGASTAGSGNSGSVSISTGQFSLLNGGLISASTFRSGTGGSVTINATKSVSVAGTDLSGFNPSLVAVSALGSGNGGNLTINSPTVIVKDSGRIDSGANIPSPIVQQFFGLSSQPSGSSGDATINTNQLSVTNNGQVTVNNDGTGNAGNLKVNANSIFLDHQGSITATTRSGEGGNITLKASSFELRHQSQISAQAGGSGNGGNISISGSSPADFVALLEGSKINANAFQGMGGNISINSQGLFVCADCQITSSSTLGLNGVVTITSPETRANYQVVDLPQEVAKPEQVVAQACPAQRRQNKSQFFITGRGGLPPQPNESLSSGALVSFDPPPTRADNSSVSSTTPQRLGNSILPPPARGWYTNGEGVVILTAESPTTTPYSSGLRSSSCHVN